MCKGYQKNYTNLNTIPVNIFFKRMIIIVQDYYKKINRIILTQYESNFLSEIHIII